MPLPLPRRDAIGATVLETGAGPALIVDHKASRAAAGGLPMMAALCAGAIGLDAHRQR